MNYVKLLAASVLLCAALAHAQDSLRATIVGDMTIRAMPPMTAAMVHVKAADFSPKRGWSAGVAGVEQAYKAMLLNGYDRLARWMKEGGRPNGPSFVIFEQDPSVATPQNLSCKIGYPVAEARSGSRAKIEQMPATMAAVVRYQGNFSDHPALRDSLERWMASRGFAPSGPMMEVYLRGVRGEAEGDDLAEIRWPVRRLDAPSDSQASRKP